MPMARCRRMSIGSNSPQTVLSPKNCYRRSTSSNTQSVAKKKGKTLAVTWLLSRWSRTWKQKVQILSSQDSAVVAPPFHRAEILTCHFLFLLHPCFSSTFMSNTLKNYCVCLIIHIFFSSNLSLFTEANPENSTLFQCLTRLCFVDFFIVSSENLQAAEIHSASHTFDSFIMKQPPSYQLSLSWPHTQYLHHGFIISELDVQWGLSI